ncbi:MAG: hypothetical protein AMJ95_11255 [Omnitrophica WOR_2 bacterium SM23_72]|nr:MAG: hypothetical protein AMJ95_11255 [Omnitrophica WOR_2 bacterium SM23_72]
MYHWFLHKTSKPDEKGEVSAGYWQDKIRETVFGLCQACKGNLLEVGCGEGLFLQKFTAQGGATTGFVGLDLSSKQLQRAKIRTAGSVCLLQADAIALPFKENSFETIVCINVFINMPREDLVDVAWKELQRVCKEEGRVLFEIRNKLNPLIRAKYKLAKYYDATIDSSRLRLFSPSAFEAKIKKMGFEVTRRLRIGFPRGRFAPVIIMEAVRRKKL